LSQLSNEIRKLTIGRMKKRFIHKMKEYDEKKKTNRLNHINFATLATEREINMK
jgi:hypothetical protein